MGNKASCYNCYHVSHMKTEYPEYFMNFRPRREFFDRTRFAVKIQAAMRGYLVRRKLKQGNLNVTHYPRGRFATPLKHFILDVFSDNQKAVILKLEPLQLPEINLNGRGELIQEYFKILHDNSVYHGEWRLGKRHGKGVCYLANGWYYEGIFIKDKPCRFGRLVVNNGDCFEGSRGCDLVSGTGVIRYFNGDFYEGGWVNSLKEGNGIFKIAKTGKKLRTFFVKDKPVT